MTWNVGLDCHAVSRLKPSHRGMNCKDATCRFVAEDVLALYDHRSYRTLTNVRMKTHKSGTSDLVPEVDIRPMADQRHACSSS